MSYKFIVTAITRATTKINTCNVLVHFNQGRWVESARTAADPSARVGGGCGGRTVD